MNRESEQAINNEIVSQVGWPVIKFGVRKMRVEENGYHLKEKKHILTLIVN